MASINNYTVALEHLQKRMASALSHGDLPLPKLPVSKFKSGIKIELKSCKKLIRIEIFLTFYKMKDKHIHNQKRE